MSTTKRFVSLHGFFAFDYPNHWVEETDEAGHYIFYNNNGGKGALRILLLPNEFEGDDAAVKMLEEVYKQNKDFDPALSKIITPGNINRSMLYFRLNTVDEAYRMPLHGRTVIHEEGVDMIEQWINTLQPCE